MFPSRSSIPGSITIDAASTPAARACAICGDQFASDLVHHVGPMVACSYVAIVGTSPRECIKDEPRATRGAEPTPTGGLHAAYGHVVSSGCAGVQCAAAATSALTVSTEIEVRRITARTPLRSPCGFAAVPLQRIRSTAPCAGASTLRRYRSDLRPR